jgi:hypothetical protein
MGRKKQRRSRSGFIAIAFKHPIHGIIRPKPLDPRRESPEWSWSNGNYTAGFVRVMDEALQRTRALLTLPPAPPPLPIPAVEQEVPDEDPFGFLSGFDQTDSEFQDGNLMD